MRVFIADVMLAGDKEANMPAEILNELLYYYAQSIYTVFLFMHFFYIAYVVKVGLNSIVIVMNTIIISLCDR